MTDEEIVEALKKVNDDFKKLLPGAQGIECQLDELKQEALSLQKRR